MLMKLAPASVATALASIVFPVPGGPNRRMPLHGCRHICLIIITIIIIIIIIYCGMIA